MKVKKKQTDEILRLALQARQEKEDKGVYLDKLVKDGESKDSNHYRIHLSHYSYSSGQNNAYREALKILNVDIPYASTENR